MKSTTTPLLRCLLCLLVCAVSAPKNLTAGNRSDKQNEPLVFRIIPQSSTIPSGSKSINIEVELRNTGQQTVTFSPVGIGTQVSIVTKPCTLNDGIRSQNTSADPLPSFRAAKIISIPPGGTYHQTMRLELAPEFFTPGMYIISMYFSGSAAGRKDVYTGDLKSNEVFFEIADPENANSATINLSKPAR